MTGRWFWGIAIFMAITATMGVMGGAEMAKADPANDEVLLEKARAALKLKNYNESLRIAQQVREANPPESKTTGEALLIVGYSQYGLRQNGEAFRTLSELVKLHPDYQKDSGFFEVLARTSRDGLGSGRKIVELFNRAIELFHAEGNTKREIALLFELAQVYQQQVYFDGDDQLRWQSRQIESVATTLATYDRILALPASADEQIRALQEKANAALSLALPPDQLAKDKWPKGLDTKYDLTKPTLLAIEFQREIANRFPERPEAANALLQVATIQSDRMNDFVAAVKTYEEIIERFPRLAGVATQARKKIDEIKAPGIMLSISDITLPGSKVKYQWSARNVDKFDVAAYPVDLAELLRSKEVAEEFWRASPTGKPVAEWSITTGDKHDYQPMHSDEQGVEAPLSESNAYLLIAKGKNQAGKETEGRAIAIVSRLSLVAKTGTSKASFYAVDSVTGEPRPKTKLLVQRFVRQVQVPVVNTWKRVFEYQELIVPDNGLAEIPLPADKERGRQQQLVAVAREGNDFAVTDGHWWGGWWGITDGLYSYVFTDRPVYRPNQTAHFKGIMREYMAGEYRPLVNQKFQVSIRDPRGAVVFEKELVTSDEGSLSGEITLGDEPALGMYMINILRDGQGISTGTGARFRVEEYKKPEFQVTVSTDKPLFKIGDKIPFKIHGDYYFGGPVAKAKVSYTIHREQLYHFIPWPRPYDWFYAEGHEFMGRFPPFQQRSDLVKQGELTTDADGNAFVEIEAKAFKNDPKADLVYRVEVNMVDESRREISASQSIKVTRQAFTISLDAKQHLYQPGDTVRIDLKSRNANDQPVPFEGTSTVSFVTQRETRDDNGKIKDEEKLQTLEAKAKNVGDKGDGEVTFVADKEGYYKITVETPDPFDPNGAKITGSTYVWVAKAGGAFAHYANRDIELVVAQETYRAGETIRLLVNCRAPKSYVLLTAEGDDLYKSQIVYVEGNQTVVEWPVEKSFQPQIAIKAVAIHDNKIFQTEETIHVPPVEQFLTVKIISPKQQFLPREEAEISIEATDSSGKPALGVELSLSVFDASILYIQPELRGDIRKYFYGRVRPVSVQTTSSYFFRSWSQVPQNSWFYTQPQFGMGGGVGGARFRRDMAMAKGMPMPAAAPMEAAPALGAPADEDFDAAAMAPTETRTDFRDAVYWSTHLVTGSDGKVTAKIKFPDSLTTWQLESIGADLKNRVGEVIHEVRTKKNILVRLQAPRFLVEGDKVVLSAIAHNYLDHAKKVRVDMCEVSGLELLGVNTSAWSVEKDSKPLDLKQAIDDVEIPAGGEKRVDFVFKPTRIGSVSATAKALSTEESDAMRLEIPVYEYGAEKLLAQSGILLGSESVRSATASLLIPKEIRPNSQSLVVKVSPTIAGVMLESLPYLIDYPYGCTEQTMSRFVPAVLTGHTLKKLGLNLAEVAKIDSGDKRTRERLEKFRANPIVDEKELAKIIAAGVHRLADFQHGDGGWGWWKQGESNAYLTAYVISGLALARDSGVSLPEGMIDRGVAFLAAKAAEAGPVKEYPWQEGDNTSLRTYMLYAIGQANSARLREPDLTKQLRRMFENRDDLTDYARALLALALAEGELAEEASIVLGNIKDRARIDKETGTASWGELRGWFYWYQSGTEATSYSLKALIKLEPKSPLIPQIVNWLVRNREGTRWFSTKDTAIVNYALADYLRLTQELDPDLTIVVSVDGREARRTRVTKQNLFTFDDELRIAAEELGTGAKEINIKAEGRGNVYWGAYAQFFTKEEKITAAGNELYVTRQYMKLIPKTVTKTRKVYNAEQRKQVDETYDEIEYDKVPVKEGDKLTSGDLIEVTIAVDAKNNFEYLLFEDPKPAGCEPVNLQSGYQWGGGFGAHTELRDEKVAFFASYLNQGKHAISYRLRAEIPGEFHALPAHGECMYAPFVRGNGDSNIIRIVDVPAEK